MIGKRRNITKRGITSISDMVSVINEKRCCRCESTLAIEGPYLNGNKIVFFVHCNNSSNSPPCKYKGRINFSSDIIPKQELKGIPMIPIKH